MLGGKSQSVHRPTAFGSLLSVGVYGRGIPNYVGTTKGPLLPINAFNLRFGKSGKKGKKSKKGPPTYVENIEILIGSNPILNVLQMWFNAIRYQLNFLSVDIESLVDGSVFPNENTIDDPNFYAIVGMTFIQRGPGAPAALSGTFNDYGAPGPVPWDMFGQEIAMWNAFQVGPDISNQSGYRFFPYTYRWNPSFGNKFYLDADIGLNPVLSGKVRVYYAQKSAQIKRLSPLQQARLTFEPQLGTGPEFEDLEEQRVVAPEFAGMGSRNIDCGVSGMIPSLVPEVQGSYSTYARGDADFTDMIELAVRSGLQHTGYDISELHRGVNCNDYPANVQKKYYYQGDPGARTLPSDYNVTKGNILLVYARKRGGGGQTISSTPAQDWTPVYNGEPDGSINVWSAVANFTGLLEIDLGNYDYDGATQFLEIPSNGLDTIDSFQMFSDLTKSPVGSITTSNESGMPAYVLAFFSAGTGIDRRRMFVPLWNELISSERTNYVDSYYRVVNHPGPVTFQAKNVFLGAARWTLFMIAFKNSGPQQHAKNLGNILDMPSIDLTRAQCRAAGLIGSVCMDAQRKALEWLDDFGKCANAAYVWAGDKLLVRPRSTRSATGNGALFIAPTAPVFHFAEKDYIKAPVFDANAQVGNDDKEDAPNILQIEHLDRNSEYNPCVTQEPDAASVALYGPRKASPQTLHMIQDPKVARMLLRMQVLRNALIGNDNWYFTVKAQNILLLPMDVGLIDDPLQGIKDIAVRLTKVSENDKFEIECEAEPFIYGIDAPDPDLIATAPAPNDTFQNINADPGVVNEPIFLEPPPRLYGSQPNAELWIPVSGSTAAYGGCAVYISTDGGLSYSQVPGDAGILIGSAITGKTTNDWPAGTDPDTVNDLAVDLSESLGSLPSFAVADEDNFLYPCYVEGGNTCTPYGLMAYAVAQLTERYKYTLKATGGNNLRRSLYGVPGLGVDVDHPLGSRFAFLNPSGVGIAKLVMDPSWIGKTLYFKFPAFNLFQSKIQSIDDSDVVAYSYTPTGCPSKAQNPNANNYTVAGGALTQPCGSPTTINMASATVTFPSNTVSYNPHSFTIPAPVAPTTYYVTILDPAYLGAAGLAGLVVYFCETSTAKVGQPGFIYIGSITALPGGCATGGGGGLPNFVTALQAFPTKSVALAPEAPGNFTVAHGLGVTPAFVLIQMTSDGAIWLQSPTSFDSTNIYFTASDAGVTGTALVFVTPADAEIALAPSAPGPFTVAHGLGTSPLMSLVEMLSDGAIRWQSTPWDATNLYLVASDAGITGKAQVMKAQPVLRPVKFARIPLNPSAVGPFTVPHGMGAVPLGVVIRMSSDAEIWPQSPGSDGTNLLLISSDPAATGEAEVWG